MRGETGAGSLPEAGSIEEEADWVLESNAEAGVTVELVVVVEVEVVWQPVEEGLALLFRRTMFRYIKLIFSKSVNSSILIKEFNFYCCPRGFF